MSGGDCPRERLDEATCPVVGLSWRPCEPGMLKKVRHHLGRGSVRRNSVSLEQQRRLWLFTGPEQVSQRARILRKDLEGLSESVWHLLGGHSEIGRL